MLQYESNDEALNYINEMLSKMRQHMSVFDLGSILIKPVQRVLKYPLLLNELIKVSHLLTCLLYDVEGRLGKSDGMG